MPEDTESTAVASECAVWVVRKVEADTGSSSDEKEPGMTKTSNCGAFSNEF